MINVIFASDHENEPQSWIAPLRRELPDVRITNWDSAAAPVGAQLAVVWKPPKNLFMRETQLEAVFNLGAGVDALLQLPGLPAGLPIVRLEDAGMGVQMAELVVHALLRASGGFVRSQREQLPKQWGPLPEL